LHGIRSLERLGADKRLAIDRRGKCDDYLHVKLYGSRRGYL
jgi:hypothetical protein